jgi:hypothetical protein
MIKITRYLVLYSIVVNKMFDNNNNMLEMSNATSLIITDRFLNLFRLQINMILYRMIDMLS